MEAVLENVTIEAEEQLSAEKLNKLFCEKVEETNERIRLSKEMYKERFEEVFTPGVAHMYVDEKNGILHNFKNAMAMAGNSMIEGIFYATENESLKKKIKELETSSIGNEEIESDIDNVMQFTDDIELIVQSLSDLLLFYRNNKREDMFDKMGAVLTVISEKLDMQKDILDDIYSKY